MYPKEIKGQRTLEAMVAKPETLEELGYSVTILCKEYLERQGERLQTYAHIMYALDYHNNTPAQGFEKPNSCFKLAGRVKNCIDLFQARNSYSADNNEVCGVLTMAWIEFYTRHVMKFLYERSIANGDMFDQTHLLKNVDIIIGEFKSRQEVLEGDIIKLTDSVKKLSEYLVKTPKKEKSVDGDNEEE